MMRSWFWATKFDSIRLALASYVRSTEGPKRGAVDAGLINFPCSVKWKSLLTVIEVVTDIDGQTDDFIAYLYGKKKIQWFLEDHLGTSWSGRGPFLGHDYTASDGVRQVRFIFDHDVSATPMSAVSEVNTTAFQEFMQPGLRTARTEERRLAVNTVLGTSFTADDLSAITGAVADAVVATASSRRIASVAPVVAPKPKIDLSKRRISLDNEDV